MLKKLRKKPPRPGGAYEDIFRSGYVRVTVELKIKLVAFEYWLPHKPTPAQMRILKDLAIKYGAQLMDDSANRLIPT